MSRCDGCAYYYVDVDDEGRPLVRATYNCFDEDERPRYEAHSKAIYLLDCYLQDAPTVDAVEVVRCGECKHKPYPSDDYNYDNGDCGFEIIFPDYRCPCRCEDEYYNRIPDDDWYCGNGERNK